MIPAPDPTKPVWVITGPTASGKTRIGIELCRRIDGEIINADAMQIYRGMDIGTAKPDREERAGVAHHLIDIRNPSDSFSVADYVGEAVSCIREIQARGHTAVICGGTGLYIQSLMEGLSFHPHARDDEVRQRLEKLADADGLASLVEQLRKLDPKTADRLDVHDRRRIIRALEVIEITGQTTTQLQAASRKEGTPFVFSAFCLNLDRPVLYARIEARVDRMIREGLVEEASGIMASCPGDTARQAIGYKEFLPYFENKSSLQEVTDRIKQSTRNYAKRQLTWFRRMDTLIWLDNSNPGQTLDSILLKGRT